MLQRKSIDGGAPFDWGKTSADYAKYRDIYPEEIYRRIHGLGLCREGQRVLDLGTGTGVLPRNMYGYGARFTGVDLSPEQIAQARALSKGMDIDYQVGAAEKLDFPDGSFDAITACTCFFYFDHAKLAPKARRRLKDGGKLLILYLSWLPFEDRIARASEQLILAHNPAWSGHGERRRFITVQEEYAPFFRDETSLIFDLRIPFTRESWHGRIRACRGVGAALEGERLEAFDQAHRAMLEQIAPEWFQVLHYCAMTVLQAV